MQEAAPMRKLLVRHLYSHICSTLGGNFWPSFTAVRRGQLAADPSGGGVLSPLHPQQTCKYLVGDQHRGYLLELMLTKLRYAAGEGNSESSSGETSGSSSGKTGVTHGLQIIGMSATMPNVGDVADWLQVRDIHAAQRPHLSIPETKAGKSHRQYRQLLNHSLMVVSEECCEPDIGGSAD